MDLYRESIHVPLIVKMPSPTRRGRVSAVVSTESLPATLLGAARIQFDSNDIQAWQSLLAMSAGDVNSDPVISATTTDSRSAGESKISVIFSGLHYIRWMASGREELYDFMRDASEQKSIADQSTDKTGVARRLVTERISNDASFRNSHRIAPVSRRQDAEVLDRLRALGYIQ